VISHTRSTNDYRQMFLDAYDNASYLRNKRGNIINIIKAYEQVSKIYAMIEDLNPDNSNDKNIIEDFTALLTELREDYYTLYTFQLRKNMLDEAGVTNEKIKACCIALGNGIEDAGKLEDARSQLIETATKLHLDYYDIPQDGNCLFHAIAHQIKINKITIHKNTLEPMHKALRRLAAEHLLNNQDYYQPSLSNGQTIAQYVKTIGVSKEWADHFEITALVRELNITLVIIQHDANLHIFKTRNNHPVLFVGYEKGMHFASLVKKPEMKIADYVVQTIKAADFVEKIANNNTDQILPISYIPSVEMTRIGNKTKPEIVTMATTAATKANPPSSLRKFFICLKTKITTQEEGINFTPDTLGSTLNPK
jgi:hypothetical protein